MNLFKSKKETNLFENNDEAELLPEETNNNRNNKAKKQDLEDSNKLTIKASLKGKKPSNPLELYYDVDQINTFANVKRVIFSNNKISESQIENLLNDEILFCKILMDLKKISFTIDEILKRISIKDLTEYYENFFNSDFLQKIQILE